MSGIARDRFRGRTCLAAVALAMMPAPSASRASPVACDAPKPKGRAAGLSVAVGGDLIGPYDSPDAADPRLAVIGRLLGSADAGFANQEGSIFDLDGFAGSLGAENGGGLPLGSARVAGALRALGFTLLAKANNHAVDFGIEGLFATERALRGAGIAIAGSGVDLAAARAPACVDTPGGRVALVATASTFPAMAVAGARAVFQGVGLRGRPGISAARVSQTIGVTPPELVALRSMGGRLGWSDDGAGRIEAFDLHGGSQVYRALDPPTSAYRLEPADAAGILGGIREARRSADLVIFSIHAHETASGNLDDPRPADFLPGLSHAAIDAGADVVVRHGPHSLSGIEVYRGRPIFYGMASLFNGLGDETRRFRGSVLPASWDDGIVAKLVFRDGRPESVLLFPIVTIREHGAILGAPALAPHDEARRILTTLQELSRPFGTTIDIRSDMGVIRLRTDGGTRFFRRQDKR